MAPNLRPISFIHYKSARNKVCCTSEEFTELNSKNKCKFFRCFMRHYLIYVTHLKIPIGYLKINA